MAYLIDLRKVLNEFKENNKYHAAFKSLMQCIFDAPSVNAVEVVRCQFCKSLRPQKILCNRRNMTV